MAELHLNHQRAHASHASESEAARKLTSGTGSRPPDDMREGGVGKAGPSPLEGLRPLDGRGGKGGTGASPVIHVRCQVGLSDGRTRGTTWQSWPAEFYMHSLSIASLTGCSWDWLD